MRWLRCCIQGCILWWELWVSATENSWKLCLPVCCSFKQQHSCCFSAHGNGQLPTLFPLFPTSCSGAADARCRLSLLVNIDFCKTERLNKAALSLKKQSTCVSLTSATNTGQVLQVTAEWRDSVAAFLLLFFFFFCQNKVIKILTKVQMQYAGCLIYRREAHRQKLS